MSTRFISAVIATALCATTAGAVTLSCDWATDKEPVSYSPNDLITFKVQIVDDGKPLAGKTLKWLRTGDDGKSAKGEAVSSDTQPLEITSSLDKPGFVRIEISVFNADGFPVKDAKGDAVKFEGGAGVEPEKMEGYPEPADFDAFWKAQKERLAAIPIKAELKEVEAKASGFKVYDVKVDCAGDKPVSGYLSIPENARMKSLGAQVNFYGYGVGGAEQATMPGMIVFGINSHGIENGREAEYYKALQAGPLNGYGFNNGENAKPETTYFNGMMLRLMRALEYVKTRPEWNGRTLIAAGGSQGGFQAVAAAALDHDVTQCNANLPWFCDLGGIRLNRLRGWRPDYADGLGYYDTANMGKRVKCPTYISAGLGDYICPPSGISVLYNNIKAPKTIVYTQGQTHVYSPPNPKEQTLNGK